MRVLWRRFSSGRGLWSVRTIVWMGVCCLVMTGCAGMGWNTSTERRTVIARIVDTSAKVIVEQGGRRLGSGSGVAVASTGGVDPGQAVSYVLTAQHVLEGKDGAAIFVRFAGANAGKGRFVATLLRHGEVDGLDLALLRIPGIAVPTALFPLDDRVRLGEEILVVGFPWGKRLGLFSGIVSQVPADSRDGGAPDEVTEQTIVVDAASAMGVSGGGVFREADGSFVGMVEGYQTASIAVEGRAQNYSVKVPMPGETFVVPVSRVRRFLEEAGLDLRSP